MAIFKRIKSFINQNFKKSSSDINQNNEQRIKLSKVFTKKELRQKVFSALEESGIIFSDKEKDSIDDIELAEYLFDSLQTILFLVSLERVLGYEIADDILISKNVSSVNTIVNVLYESNFKKIVK